MDLISGLVDRERRSRDGSAADAAAAIPVAGGTCALVAGIAAGQGETISVAELSVALSERGLAVLLLLFAAPSALPVAIPGLSAVLALPLLAVAVHLVLGWQSPSLPGFLGRRSISRDRFAAIVERVGPALSRVERGLRPRWAWLTRSGAQRLVGLLVLVLALAIAVPFPLSNSLPGLGICVIALGLLERDGLAVAAGCAIGLFALAVIAGLLAGAMHASGLLLAAIAG